MEMNCSNINHKNKEAIKICQECKLYMCNNCLKFHSELHPNHDSITFEISDAFNDICKEQGHNNKFKYFCETHNQFCCVACIAKITSKGDGQHYNCKVYAIEDIKQAKIDKLEENKKYLENLSKTIHSHTEELNKLYEELNTNKESIKKIIQQEFTKLKNILNNREDELLNAIDKIFNDYYDDDKIKKSQKIDKQIKITLDKSKTLDKYLNDNNYLNYLISICIDIENTIKDINKFNEDIKKLKIDEFNVKYNSEIDILSKIIQNYGLIEYTNCSNLIKYKLYSIKTSKDNNVLLISHNSHSDLYHLLKLNISTENISVIKPESILDNPTYSKLKHYKVMIYDLIDGGYRDTKNVEEIKKYLVNGGIIIVTHDQWTVRDKSNCLQLLGAKNQKCSIVQIKKAKILNIGHPIFKTFYDLSSINKNIEISETHRPNSFGYENKEEYYKNLLIELDDKNLGAYLLIKEVGKGKIIYWNAGHSPYLNDFERKLFINCIYWIFNN